MKEIFVVDGNLDITPIQIEETDWQEEVFSAELNSQPIIICRGGWNKLTTYGGFESKTEAEEFRALVAERQRR